MATTSQQIETQHVDMIHDCALNYFGTLLATCSSDRTIKIFSVPASPAGGVADAQQPQGQSHGSGQELLDTLRGHEGPVWQVAWAHPKFGNILASCSYDGKVFVWRQTSNQGWQRIKDHTLHNASVNSVSWAPPELGAMLACASSDGKVSVLTFNDDNTWDASLFVAHPTGCNAVSWAPATLPGSLTAPAPTAAAGHPQQQQQQQQIKRFATGGCDSLVHIWIHNSSSQKWECESTLEGHTDWVRDVAWQDNIGLNKSYLASASQDKTVIVHIHDASTNTWSSTTLDPQGTGATEGSKFADTVWRVSWSVSGAVLAVSCGDGKISLWKESLTGKFEMVNDMEG